MFPISSSSQICGCIQVLSIFLSVKGICYFYITLRHNSNKVSPVCVVNLNAHYCSPPGMTAHSAMWTLINFNNPYLGTSFFSKLFCYNYHLGKAKQLFSTTELGKETQVHSTFHSTLGTVLNIYCSNRWQ